MHVSPRDYRPSVIRSHSSSCSCRSGSESRTMATRARHETERGARVIVGETPPRDRRGRPWLKKDAPRARDSSCRWGRLKFDIDLLDKSWIKKNSPLLPSGRSATSEMKRRDAERRTKTRSGAARRVALRYACRAITTTTRTTRRSSWVRPMARARLDCAARSSACGSAALTGQVAGSRTRATERSYVQDTHTRHVAYARHDRGLGTGARRHPDF